MKKFTETNLGIWLIAIIPTIFTYISTIKSINMNINISQHFPFIFSISILLLIISILYFRKWILVRLRKINDLELLTNHLRVRQKFYDIMLTKFNDQYPSHICSVFQDDINLFTKDEIKYLNEYFKNLEDLKTKMKGKNECEGMFL